MIFLFYLLFDFYFFARPCQGCLGKGTPKRYMLSAQDWLRSQPPPPPCTTDSSVVRVVVV